jgi:hypothetical protein
MSITVHEKVKPPGGRNSQTARLDQLFGTTDRDAAIAMLELWAIQDDQLTESDLNRNREVLRAIDGQRPHRRLFDSALSEG